MKVGDTVKIISGDNKGTEAKIVKVDRKNGKACLEGIGLIERHLKKSYFNPAGGKKTIHVGIDMSNLKLVKAADAKATTKAGAKTSAKSGAKSDKGAKAKKGAK
ncbi:50S ribosomal protein L24 [Candidatus Saccharibacteria bacterium]|nr:50S ribosomal protein L24 [Candidatus Saccharibacteria bacterium]